MSDYDVDNRAESYLLTDDTYRKKYFTGPTFLKLLGVLKGKVVVDVGCGSGFSTRLIKQVGAKEVVGIDCSTIQIKLAKQNEKQHPQGLEYYVGDLASASFSFPKKCDVVAAEYVLHYAKTFDELVIMCKNISSLLTMHGTFVAMNQSPMDFKKGGIEYNEVFDYFGQADGALIRGTLYTNSGEKICTIDLHHWSKESYEKALTLAGFTQIRWHTLIVTHEARAFFGAKKAQEFIDNLPTVGLTCQKG